MSVVTNVLILTSCSEDYGNGTPPIAIESINADLLREPYSSGFKEIGRYAGGNKKMERLVYAAAVNGLKEKELYKSLINAPWENEDQVQVLMSREDEEGFSLFWGLSLEE